MKHKYHNNNLLNINNNRYKLAMKLSLSLPVLLAASAVQGFAPAIVPQQRCTATTTTLFARPDASEAIKKAMVTSKKFGPTSSEARLAWEAVEEMDGSSNRCGRMKHCFLLLSGYMPLRAIEIIRKRKGKIELNRIARICLHSPWFSSFLPIKKKHHQSTTQSQLRSIIFDVCIKIKQTLPRTLSQHSAATGGSLADECELTDGEVSKACMEYDKNLEELQKMLKENAPFIQKMKSIASDLENIKMTTAPAVQAKDSPELRAAVAEAKKATDEFGPTSSEARLAWESVEEIASAGNAGALGGKLSTEECLVETAEACEALEKLEKALEL